MPIRRCLYSTTVSTDTAVVGVPDHYETKAQFNYYLHQVVSTIIINNSFSHQLLHQTSDLLFLRTTTAYIISSTAQTRDFLFIRTAHFINCYTNQAIFYFLKTAFIMSSTAGPNNKRFALISTVNLNGSSQLNCCCTNTRGSVHFTFSL